MLMGAKRMKIAELVRITGISQSTALRLYHDKTGNISFKTMDKICYALECTPSELFEYIEN